MKYSLLLAWRYLTYHPARSAILCTCVALAFLLPFSVKGLVGDYTNSLVRRSRATPLIAGALGSRYDLVLNSLYFAGRVPRQLSMREADELIDSGFARVVPLLLGESAGGYPLIGTDPDYFKQRALELSAGEFPLLLGEAVIGARVSNELQLQIGDTILTDDGSLYDLSLRAPLRLRVTGILKEARTPDDGAVFADVKTVWIVMGIGHGHAEAASQSENRMPGTTATDSDNPQHIVLGAATYEFTEITTETAANFHFHGDRADFPITALLLFPHDQRSATILKGRYRASDQIQLLEPLTVVQEILGLVFKVKLFFDANTLLVTISTALFLSLLLLLSIHVRRHEIETLSKIGCARLTVARVLGLELAILLTAGLALSFTLSLLLEHLLQNAIGI